ncbi:DUF3347 domain-containing protein [Aquimarina sp. TRL1]|uniref:DUF3347 domain-containing protein n=1 Tax=Aquimarina sp. (strain TRL1) TaxID=2736252 RepID=UPI00158C550B|nr:DUF3347 domain-containing protein [Aquimarina sp. TRL1]QKX04248.1 DUF3347 domain-containing protein [Aquimarina sp. TRL1]
MKTSVVKIIVVAISFGIFSCGKDKKEPVNKTSVTVAVEEDKPIVDINKTSTKSTVVFADPKTQKLYGAYLQIKRGLVNSDLKGVKNAAKELEGVIGEDTSLKQLKATASLMSLTKELTKQRDFLVGLTEEMERILKGVEITSGEIYKQFCPMAFEGKGGYWLSDSKEVRNPYYGDKMLKCGSVEKTIQ